MVQIDAAAGSPVPAGRPAHVLVADDDSADLLHIATFLEGLGYTHETASNGFEALAVLRRTPFAAVLVACQMSEMDGCQATRAIRAGVVGSRRLPVIGMTASVEDEREKCLAAGMDDLLTMPVDAQALGDAPSSAG
jgi:two-component system sensor histidine kinase/response regulator